MDKTMQNTFLNKLSNFLTSTFEKIAISRTRQALTMLDDKTLEDIGIEYKFLNNELIAINMVALNGEDNSVSEKLTLMNYAKNNYGNFDTTQNPKAYSGFEIYEKSNQFIVYQRLPGDDGIMNEQIYITTKELDAKLMNFYTKMELEGIE